jgi:hypothetical protein
MDDLSECRSGHRRRCDDETFDRKPRGEASVNEEDEGVDGIWERGNLGSGG